MQGCSSRCRWIARHRPALPPPSQLHPKCPQHPQPPSPAGSPTAIGEMGPPDPHLLREPLQWSFLRCFSLLRRKKAGKGGGQESLSRTAPLLPGREAGVEGATPGCPVPTRTRWTFRLRCPSP